MVLITGEESRKNKKKKGLDNTIKRNRCTDRDTTIFLFITPIHYPFVYPHA